MIKDNYEYAKAQTVLNIMANNCCREVEEMKTAGIDPQLALDVADAASQDYENLFDEWNDYRVRMGVPPL